MGVLPLFLSLTAGVCMLLGIFTAVEVLPPFITAGTAMGPALATTGFLWGLSGLLFLASIAASVNRQYTPYE